MTDSFLSSRAFLVAALLSAVACAEPIQELAEFTENQVRTLTSAVQQSEASPATNWSFRSFSVAVHADVGFKVPGFQLALIPELILTWQRPKKPQP